MPDKYLPLLIFPAKQNLPAEQGRGFPPGQRHLPSHANQIARIDKQIELLTKDFKRYQASLSDGLSGLEPETVLVIEIVGHLDDFKQAIEAIDLEWPPLSH